MMPIHWFDCPRARCRAIENVGSTADARRRPREDWDWQSEPDRYERDIDEAVAVCGGDERAAVRSLLVLTEFLELEAFGEAGVQYRRERLSR